MIRIANPRRRLATPGLSPAVVALATLAALVLAPSAAPAMQDAQSTESPPPAPPAEEEPPIPDPPRFLTDVIANIGDVAGDIFWWGQGANVTGTVLNNAFLGGQTVTIDGGTVGSDLFAFAQTIVIDGVVRQNVYAFAQEVRIAEGAVVHGNVLVFAGSIRNDGTIRGQLQGSGGITYLGGEIGSVALECGTLTIAPDVRILGDLQYEATDEVTVPEGAVIGGELQWNQPQSDDDDEETPASGFSLWSIGWKAWSYLSSLVVGFAFLLLGGRGARLPADCLRRQPAPGLGFGFVVAVVFPVACVVAIALIVTLPLGIIGLGLFVLMLILARLVTAQFVGDWVLRRLGRATPPSEYLALALGLLLFYLVALIPYVGFLIRYTGIVLGIGGIYLALRASGFPATPATSEGNVPVRSGTI